MLANIFKAAVFVTLLSSTTTTQASEITVSAASSLTDAFKEIASSFEKAHPKTKIHLNLAASGTLLQQLAKGAPVDVIAFADLETMDVAESQGLVKANERKIFAGNSLVVVLPKDGKLTIKQLHDLTKPEFRRIAIGNPDSVPAGRYAKIALTTVGSWEALGPKFIQTQNVRQALDYVARGEVDAGIVYKSDATILKDHVSIALDLTDQNFVAIRYPMATATESKNSPAGKVFVDYVMSDAGQDILSKFGFKKP